MCTLSYLDLALATSLNKGTRCEGGGGRVGGCAGYLGYVLLHILASLSLVLFLGLVLHIEGLVLSERKCLFCSLSMV